MRLLGMALAGSCHCVLEGPPRTRSRGAATGGGGPLLQRAHSAVFCEVVCFAADCARGGYESLLARRCMPYAVKGLAYPWPLLVLTEHLVIRDPPSPPYLRPVSFQFPEGTFCTMLVFSMKIMVFGSPSPIG
jgi:hypothetical protein